MVEFGMGICLSGECREYAAKELCRFHQRRVKLGLDEPRQGWVTTTNPPCSVPTCSGISASCRGLLCPTHAHYKKIGRDFDDVRAKRPNGVPSACAARGCGDVARSKGYCSAHYYEEYVRVPSVLSPCSGVGCTRRTGRASGRCGEHDAQFDFWGITWSGDRPNERLNDIRESRKPTCSVNSCERRATSGKAVFCRLHVNDMNRKGFTSDQYIKLMSATVCESCGSGNGKIVTDHAHAHHIDPEKMCPDCIRGRLCNGCNSALGFLGEDAVRIRALAEYISRFQ